ncbi:MAG: NAD(+) synthase [Clostridia bacterium]|nr:NAD(+) synthase [Clostridia bacterium]
MRDYKKETEMRVAFIRAQLEQSGARGIVFGNSGGKDCALVGILCKMACENTVSVMLPCSSSVNFGKDLADARALCESFGIENRMVDLTRVKEALLAALEEAATLNDAALTNIAPRLRMTTLYAIGAAEGRLVAGTGNRSERYMGYFTKWGDGGHDFNPISDLTVTEVYEFLRHLGAPSSIIEKAPSAGLYEGQTDEQDMGVTYRAVDEYILCGTATDADRAVIDRYHARSLHKLRPIPTFEAWQKAQE